MDVLTRKMAAILFYGSLTLLPTLVWIIANYYERMSYLVLWLLAVMPLLVFNAVRGILDEPPAATATAQQNATPIPG